MDNKINFGFIGNGGISKAIQMHSLDRNHSVQAVHNRDESWEFDDSDVIIECTSPESFLEHFEDLCALQKDIVIVTTGWYEQMDRVRNIVIDADIRVMWSSNFSIGVQLYFKMIQAAAKMINNYEDYDIWATELHHKKKVDAPSGTAKVLGDILIENIDRKSNIIEETLHRSIEEDEIHFSSTRGGVVNFAHTIGFDSAEDVIEIKHTARNRNGYALGVIKAAEWLRKQAPGFYGMDDFMKG